MTNPYQHNEDAPYCDCEDCRITRDIQGLAESITLAPMGVLVLPPFPEWRKQVDTSNSGDLDRSYEDAQ